MRTIVSSLLFFAICSIAVPASVVAASVEDELNELEEMRYAALIGKDWQALDGLLADEFFYNTGTGASLPKTGFLDYMKAGTAVVRKASREETRVRAYGNVALVTGIAHVDVTLKGEDKTLHSRYLHVWNKGEQGWKLVARQATYLPEKK